MLSVVNGDTLFVLSDTYPLTAMEYNYDIHGNVDSLLNIAYFGSPMFYHGKNKFKLIAYKYDLISGKVNEVHYQPGENDEFYHRYIYDADNRLVDVYTTDVKAFVGQAELEEHEVRYEYYKHGPLARVVLGQQQVQGTDYAYTLEGWLKGVNSTSLDPDFDMGNDGKIAGTNKLVARDELGFNLNYFTGEYSAISTSAIQFPGHTAYMPGGTYKPLFNGNISSMAVNINKFSQPQLYNYAYDQLNRIVAMDVYRNLSSNSWSGITSTGDYKERVAYDANGNITKYQRQGYGANLNMDSLTYNYNVGTNQLNYVRDRISNSTSHNSNYSEDIDDQSNNNYQYDAIGNLISDAQEGINSISWNVYGKIRNINRYANAKSSAYDITYFYDPNGNRVGKNLENYPGPNKYIWYVRDAQGNVMAVYEKTAGTSYSGDMFLKEHHLYGSSRLGLIQRNQNIDSAKVTAVNNSLLGPTYVYNFERGKKLFELSNHLGNVLVTISDKKYGHVNGSAYDYFTADVVNANDYYPFGMVMPNRKYAASSIYRYGFNGKEIDPETMGEGNQYDYGFRIYNPRIGRFLSVDPLNKNYPELTPYQFASNSPITGKDRDGLEFENATATHQMYIGQLFVSDENKMTNSQIQQWGSAMDAGIRKGYLAGLGISAGVYGLSYLPALWQTSFLSGAATWVSNPSNQQAVANVGAFFIEVLNPDPNGTPGLEFSQADEVARGLKLMFKEFTGPIIKPIEKFIVNTNKLDYFFGKLAYQSLKGQELEAYASKVGRNVVELKSNQDRALSMANVFEFWGIKDNKVGFEKLIELFNSGLKGKEISSKTDEFGTSIRREISLVFTAGKKKGQSAGNMEISYFYKNGNMNAIPEITSVIPKPSQTP